MKVDPPNEMTIIEELEQVVEKARGLRAIKGEKGVAIRARSLELLEIHFFDRLPALSAEEAVLVKKTSLSQKALDLVHTVEKREKRVLQRLQDRIRQGRFTSAGWRRALGRLLDPNIELGYDVADLLTLKLFDGGEAPVVAGVLEPEMVAYQPTPVRVLLDLVQRTRLGPGDVLYDMGSGLGQVLLVVSLLSGARTIGVEIEPAYCEHARSRVERSGLRNIDVVEGDARKVPLKDGTVYFLYTPFRGKILDEVLGRLRREALQRPIRVCAYGPCVPSIASVDWLRPQEDTVFHPHSAAVFYSR